MSFTQGFEKVAVIAKGIGALGGLAAKGGREATKAISQFATGQRASRLQAYRGVLSGKKGEIGGLAAGKAVQKMQAKSPGMDAKTLGKKTEEIQTAKKGKALSKLDAQKTKKSGEGGGFIKKHPYLTAAGVYMAARSMSGNDQQTPPPPPQVVQY